MRLTVSYLTLLLAACLRVNIQMNLDLRLLLLDILLYRAWAVAGVFLVAG